MPNAEDQGYFYVLTEDGNDMVKRFLPAYCSSIEDLKKAIVATKDIVESTKKEISAEEKFWRSTWQG